jgi:hypothetical protein
MPRKTWFDFEDDFLRKLYPMCRTELLAELFQCSLAGLYNRAQALGLKKDPGYLEAHCRLRPGVRASAATEFKPGGAPWNKGMKGLDFGGRSHETRFKPGSKPQTWRPIGSNRMMDGYMQRKVADTGYSPSDYVMVHHLVWRMHGHTIPPGHVLVFCDRDRTNVDINNLELIHRSELMRRNTVHNLPRELKEVVDLKRGLTRRINNLEASHHGK